MTGDSHLDFARSTVALLDRGKQKTTASYEVITETLRKIGPSLAAQFANPGYCTLQQKTDNDSLFVALAWCEGIGRAQ